MATGRRLVDHRPRHEELLHHRLHRQQQNNGLSIVQTLMSTGTSITFLDMAKTYIILRKRTILYKFFHPESPMNYIILEQTRDLYKRFYINSKGVPFLYKILSFEGSQNWSSPYLCVNSKYLYKALLFKLLQVPNVVELQFL